MHRVNQEPWLAPIQVNLWQNHAMNSRVFVISLTAVGTVLSYTRQAVMLLGQNERRSGRVEGTVLCESGEPVKGVTVTAPPLDRLMGAIVPHGNTDDFGHLQINHLWLGKVAVTAKRETEGRRCGNTTSRCRGTSPRPLDRHPASVPTSIASRLAV
jgi:hypothetical protein